MASPSIPTYAKTILVRPQGGLNDMFAQIARCLDYAERYQRTLYVDTAANPKFQAPLNAYFESTGRIVFLSPSEERRLNHFSTYPPEIAGRIEKYKVFHEDGQPIRESQTRVPLTFDFATEFHEELIVHHQFGGGLNSVQLLNELRLKNHILREVAARIEMLGKSFEAIHIRNTDYQTDWLPQLEAVISRMRASCLYIATDDPLVPREAVKRFPNIRILCAADLRRKVSLDVNAEALVDLLLLAFAEELWVLKLDNANVKFSGFSLFAKFLWSVMKVGRVGLFGFLRSKSLFLDFHHSNIRTIRVLFFFGLTLPKIMRMSKTQTFIPASSI